jgi:hypothetical protein
MWYNLRETWLDLPEPRQPFLEIGLQNMNIFYAGHHATAVFGVKANSGFLGRFFITLPVYEAASQVI